MSETKNVRVSVDGKDLTIYAEVYEFGILTEGCCDGNDCNGNCSSAGFQDFYLEDDTPKGLLEGVHGAGYIWMPDDDHTQKSNEIIAYLPRGVERAVRFK